MLHPTASMSAGSRAKSCQSHCSTVVLAALQMDAVLVLIGGAGAGIMNGGNGDDVLLGGPGLDNLDGGLGSNVVIQK